MLDKAAAERITERIRLDRASLATMTREEYAQTGTQDV